MAPANGSSLVINIIQVATLTSQCMLPIIPRDGWAANPPKLVERIDGPVGFVIIHHSYIPPACGGPDQDSCASAMKKMQYMHQITNGWNDIGYSFAVGGDGNIYTGRGFGVVGAHAPRYNDKSVGICLIGDWRTELPSEQMLSAVKSLIECGIATGKIAKDYTLLGHRQVRDTECPGGRLYDEVSKWPHYSPYPSGPEDVNEIATK